MLKRLLVTGLALLALALPAPAQQSTAPQADRRAVYEENTDFFGGDIRSLFDTTIEICEAACLVERSAWP